MQDDLLIDQTIRKVVGIKQSRRVIKDGCAEMAYIADDAEDRVRSPLILMCKENDVPFEIVPSMKELGKASGIRIGTAVTVILK